MDKMGFQVTIKGLFFDESGKVLVARERSGRWDLPGGRLEHGEDFHSTLTRECREEMGLDCKILDRTPRLAWTAQDQEGLWKVALCFRISLPHLDFTPSDECVALGFFDKTGLDGIDLVPQMAPLKAFL